jgi:crotonobetainyl-CoA:carnitine CoA-transferase CaiB-like acyl-CoA transferase
VTWDLDPTNVGTGLPLEGVRVLDLSRVLAGPLCAMVVGDLGADVIKVESPEGDPVRSLGPPYFADDATYYLSVNRHRRNVVADLRNEEDFQQVGELVKVADAVIENYLPRQFHSLGIERLRALNPDCVWVSITPASEGGPLADSPSFDLLAQARSGLMGVTGEPDGVPSKVGAPIADVVTGLYGAVGLLSGLFARAKGRGGQRYEAPLLESAMSALINQAQGYLSTTVNPQRLGNDHPSIAPYGPVKTADGYLLLAVGTDAQYQSLVTLLGDAALEEKKEWVTNASRVTARTELKELLGPIFETQSSDAWLRVLEGAGVPCAPILDVAGAFAQEQITQGDFVGVMETPGGETRAMRTPLRIDTLRPPIRRGPRAIGADTEELFRGGAD